jgi:hypothetical protein
MQRIFHPALTIWYEDRSGDCSSEIPALLLGQLAAKGRAVVATCVPRPELPQLRKHLNKPHHSGFGPGADVLGEVRRKSAAPGRFDRSDINLLHAHHRFERPLCFIPSG